MSEIGKNIELIFEVLDQQSRGQKEELICDPVRKKTPLDERMGKSHPYCSKLRGRLPRDGNEQQKTKGA